MSRDGAAVDVAAVAADVARVREAVRLLLVEQERDRAALINLSADMRMNRSDYERGERVWSIVHGRTVGAEPVATPSDIRRLLDDAPAPDPAPDCPRCGNNRQVWRNQITGRLRCHRVGCEADLPAPPPPALDAETRALMREAAKRVEAYAMDADDARLCARLCAAAGPTP